MGLVQESSGTTEVGLKDMADQAEFVWFSRLFFVYTYYVPSFVFGLVGEMGDVFAMWSVLKRQSQPVNPEVIIPQSFHPSHLHICSVPG